jgi:hypothetical protein
MTKKEAIALPVLAVATGVAVLLQAKKLAYLSGLALVGLGLNSAMQAAADKAIETPVKKRTKSRRSKRAVRPRKARAHA